MRSRRRLLVGSALAMGLAAAGCGDDGSSDKGEAPDSGNDKARAALEKLDGDATAKRVSALRTLKFTGGVPKLKIVKPEDSKSFVRRQVERNYPDKRIAADEDFYRLAGMIPASSGVRELLDKFSAGLILGYYDRENPDELSLVTSKRAAKPKAAESTLAHELTHALQDQEYGLKRFEGVDDPERSNTGAALIEGDAQLLESVYDKKFQGGGPKASSDTAGLPPAFLLYASFPYQFGSKFVATLVKQGRGYKLVDRAFRKPPETTEQVLHPRKYFSGERARDVRTPPAKVLGSGWKAGGVEPFGELDALAILSTKTLPQGAAGKALGQAAAGWDGGARALFARGGARALAISTTWESVRDAREFATAYVRSLKKDRAAKKASSDAVEIAGVGAVSVLADGRDVTLAVAPDAKLAAKLAKGR